MDASGVQIQREKTLQSKPLPVQDKKSFFSKIKNVFNSKPLQPSQTVQVQDSQEPLLPTRKLLSTKSKNPKGNAKKIVILSLIIVITLVMILALLAGLFWDKFF
ncbi:hypothetical protein HN604_00310 [archaeon]|jgi:hypothetical protein|nr:hypothetical protein [archaeon]MBT6182842.1 hypothetical protein [archaeon]MBT6606802.1 hypothetical protein [archaeon]MBT7251725.1 hypothetical protein [archaeon]MBT7660508.1 hypothetical protein [archaeon]